MRPSWFLRSLPCLVKGPSKPIDQTSQTVCRARGAAPVGGCQSHRKSRGGRRSVASFPVEDTGDLKNVRFSMVVQFLVELLPIFELWRLLEWPQLAALRVYPVLDVQDGVHG